MNILVVTVDSYEIRLNNAKKDLKAFENDDMWTKVVKLWQKNYSLRIISEISGISRSKLQRYFAENEIDKIDDIRTQNRNERVKYAKNLEKMGFSKQEIAQELHVNPRTVDSYFKQVGIKAKTKFGDENADD